MQSLRWWQRVALVLRRHGYILPIYLVLTLLFTYPTVVLIDQAIGGQQDALENYWNLWWTHEAVIERGHDPFDADLMHRPFGLLLYFHTFNILNGILSLPIQMCCGTAVAYNVMNWFAFVGAGITMYMLVWYLTQRRAAAFMAGLVFAFSPYMAFHLDVGQPFMQSVEWMPLYTLVLLKGLRERWQYLLLAGFVLTLIGLTDWYYLSFIVTMTGVVGLYEMARLRQWPAIGWVVAKLALVGLLFLILISPVLVPMIAELRSNPYAVRPLIHSIYHSTDVVSFFLPSIFHPLWGEWASEIFFNRLAPEGVGGMATLGFVAMILGGIGIARTWKRSALFFWIFVVFVILSLGPYLQFNGWNSYMAERPIPLPYLIFRELPFMNVARIPSRFISVVMLALAVLVGFGVAWLWQQPWVAQRSSVARRALLGGLALLLLFEYWPAPFRTTQITPDQVSPFFVQLGAERSEEVVFEVPYLERPSMFNQTYHEKPTIGGRISRQRVHPWWNARVFGPLMQVVHPWEEIEADTSAEAWRSALICQDVRYVVFYQKDAPRKSRSRALERRLFPDIAPIYEDEILRAYRLPDETPRELYWTPTADEWYDAEVNETGLTYRWMKGDHASLLLYPCGEPTEAILRFQAFTQDQSRTLEVRLNGELVGTFALPHLALTPIEVPLSLPAGENRLELRSVEPAATIGDDPRLLSINVSQVSLVPR